ncbi:MAG: hypothetical protein ABW122_00005 [Ilumatobacteraceae bacterium]
MTIRPGETWGEEVEAPADLASIVSDAALAAHVESGDPRAVLLTGGDLLQTLGGPSAVGGLLRFPIDVLRVVAEDRSFVAVAHVIARDGRSRGWRGPIVAVMNVDRRGPWDVAPRAHPNDGRADVVEVDASMGFRARREARRRLPSGTHVPHPAIRVTRTADRSWSFARPLGLWLDGVARGPVRSLHVTVDPDAATVHT